MRIHKPQVKYQLINATTGQVLIKHLEVADSIWTRFRGWMFKTKTLPNSAILIRPCSSIHTMWMRMTIDVAYLSKDNIVIGSRKSLRPWRIAIAPKGTTAVIETPAGQSDLCIGTSLRIEAAKP
jgi:uncharacterized membrane protein (UPF0127 family)